MRQIKRYRVIHHPQHALDFKCVCPRCIRMHTPTEDDLKLLHDLRIKWTEEKEEHVVKNKKSKAK